MRFGVYEIDTQDEELFKHGVRLRIQKKPFQILKRLLATPGELVTRVELSQLLWPELHVLFNGSLNTAVNVLRRVLRDPPRNPHFIETRSGVGYRFIGPVERVPERHVVDQTPHPGGIQNFEAYQDYCKGRFFCTKMTEDDLRKSVAYFEAALAAEPQYALAYAGLADTYCSFAFLGTLPSMEALKRAKEYALAALRIDGQLAEANLSFAQVKHLLDRDPATTEIDYRRALALNPNSARARYLYAGYLCAIEKPEAAREQIHLALELDPLSLDVNTEAAWQRYLARDFQGAIEQAWRILAMEPKFAPAQHILGLAYEQMGMLEEAAVELENACSCWSKHPMPLAALAHVHASAGDRTQATQLLDELQNVASERHVSPYWFAVVHAGLGEREPALHYLNEASAQRDVWTIWTKVDPRFAELSKA